MCEVGERSFARPSASVVDGKIMLLRAAIDPLIPTTKINNSARATNARSFDGILRFSRRPPLANHAVIVRNARRTRVFKRCAAIQNGRSGVRFSAVFPVSTKPAPRRPSMTTKRNEPIAARNILRVFSLRSQYQIAIAQTSKMIMTIPASELVMRCENSITVFNCGADGKPGVVRWANILSILVVTQVAFGAATLLMLAPIVMQLGHLFLADAIWISTVLFTASFLEDESGEFSDNTF